MLFSLWRQGTSADVSFERFHTLLSKNTDRTSTFLKTNRLLTSFQPKKTYILKNIFPTTKLRGPVVFSFLRPSWIPGLGMTHRRWIFFTISPKTSSHFCGINSFSSFLSLLTFLFLIFLFCCLCLSKSKISRSFVYRINKVVEYVLEFDSLVQSINQNTDLILF